MPWSHVMTLFVFSPVIVLVKLYTHDSPVTRFYNNKLDFLISGFENILMGGESWLLYFICLPDVL